MTAIAAEDESPEANGKTVNTKAVVEEEKVAAEAKGGAKKEKKEKKDKKRKSVGGDEAAAEVREDPRLVCRFRPDLSVCV